MKKIKLIILLCALQPTFSFAEDVTIESYNPKVERIINKARVNQIWTLIEGYRASELDCKLFISAFGITKKGWNSRAYSVIERLDLKVGELIIKDLSKQSTYSSETDLQYLYSTSIQSRDLIYSICEQAPQMTFQNVYQRVLTHDDLPLVHSYLFGYINN